MWVGGIYIYIYLSKKMTVNKTAASSFLIDDLVPVLAVLVFLNIR